ncbi:nuclear transport factor 2 family protein [Bradyrhizobium sp. BWA-3-5]|uniref:YybH family protein n=1 Tax=Bradyrhizobium sp. BWA-3-5 TaxID=3080013 RepID=UPI00293EB92E|nr:nuclear transport factor 2 family protein [Bradyrhizobium sp. BWA-3-5]WOH69771.1 nuclear transport factor 2 family protein [Bradyrhizobium sp. BWA-3-5]
MSKNCPTPLDPVSSSALSRRHALSAMAIMPLVVAEAATADDVIARLLAHTQQANAALMRGDAETYRKMVAITDDFTLMSPFGGEPSKASQYATPEKWDRMARFFKNGTHKHEVVQSYVSQDMVVLALIERDQVDVGGLPAQEWALRVTLVYRRDGAQWRLVHRHADPLANGISLQQAAALARGLPASE